MSTLLDELQQRDLLKSTLILWMGEFGRTPKINENDGRDHYPQVWSAVMAGGGVRGGQALGETSPDGTTIVTPSIHVPDLMATAATLVGMNPQKSFDTPVGRPIAITDGGRALRELIAAS
jgi:uncharacterized protein (DUF1501 family)